VWQKLMSVRLSIPIEMPASRLQSGALQPAAMWNRLLQNRSVHLGAVSGLNQRRPMQVSGTAVLPSMSMRRTSGELRRYRCAASPMCWHRGTGCERGERGGRSRACIRDPVPAGRGPRRECPGPGRHPRALCFACWAVGCFDWESPPNTPCDLRFGPVGGAARTACRSHRRRAGASDLTTGRPPFREIAYALETMYSGLTPGDR